jgi:hypothetical protein
MTERVSEILNEPRKIDTAWKQHFENMLNDGTAAPEEAAESMLRIASLIAEGILGPRKTAATMVLAALYFTRRISEDIEDAKNSEIRH